MARVRLYSDRVVNQIVSHLPEVHRELGEHAASIQARARGRLALHYYEGDSKIEVTEGAVDWFVSLVDHAAMSIEFGHWVGGKYRDPDKPKFVQGLYIITGAAGLAGGVKQGPRRARK